MVDDTTTIENRPADAEGETFDVFDDLAEAPEGGFADEGGVSFVDEGVEISEEEREQSITGGKDDPYRTVREKFETNVDYTTVLSNFEGPLDLLLYLIKRAEIEIKDVFVSQVTEQFLDYMKGLPYLDVEKVTEYLAIAATIIKIKAQALVPSLDEYEDDDSYDPEEEKAEFIRALEEYNLIKEEMGKLKELETVGYVYKEPDKDVGEIHRVFSLENLTLNGLIAAFSALIVEREKAIIEEEVREIPRDEYTVEQKIVFILEVFENLEEVRFEELFTKDYTRSEIVTTFQALLELLKHQYLQVVQEEAFGQIRIRFNPESSHVWVGQQIDEYE